MSRTDDIFIAKAEAPEERAACFAIRTEVFVGEQGVYPEGEMDEYDKTALHFLALQDGKPIATARVVFKDNGTTAKIGRVAVRKEARGRGIGAAIMLAMEADPEVQQKAKSFILHAQTRVVPFYEKVGYTAYGEEFMEEGIPHYAMSKNNQYDTSTSNLSPSKAAV